jgi:hypothetical protein
MVDRAAYLKHRANGHSVKSAGFWARQALDAPEPLDWQDVKGWPKATWEEGRFRVEVKRQYDECPDVSFLGSFTDKWEPGAILHNRNRDRNTYKWFVPGNSEEGHRKSLRAMGYTKHDAYTLARSYVRQDYQRMLGLDRGDWFSVGIVATVYDLKTGIELGGGSCWGFESDSGDDYFDSEARAIASEALSEARQNVTNICACSVEP